MFLIFIIISLIRECTQEYLNIGAYTFLVGKNNYFSLKIIIIEYIKLYNYSPKIVYFEDTINISNVDLTLMDTIEYSGPEPNPFTITAVTPFYSLNLVIPSKLKTDKFEYFIMPFQRSTWILITISIPFLAAVLKLSYLGESKYIDSLFSSFKVFVNQAIDMKSNNLIHTLIIIFIIWFSFFITMLYLTYLGLYLTQPPDKSKFTIMCPENRLEDIKKLYKGDVTFMKIGYPQYLNHLYSYNTSYGYCTTSTFWNSNFGQKGQFLFKTIGPWVSTYDNYLRFNKSSKYYEQFNKYILNSYTFGLNIKYNMDIKRSIYYNISQYFLNSDGDILRFEDFWFQWFVLAVGYILGGICFCFETFYYLFS